MESAKARLGSFYLRVGAVAFGIGSMVYSGLEFGQYFELKGKRLYIFKGHFQLFVQHAIRMTNELHSNLSGEKACQNVLIALTPATRMVLSIVQMQFIFLNTKEFEVKRHKVIVRFGLMHMLATNLCEWLNVLVEETRHEISNNIENATGKQFGSLPVATIMVCVIFSCEFAAHRPSAAEWNNRSNKTCDRIRNYS